MADFIFGKECKIVCYSLMTSGKVGSTAAFVFSETDGSVPVDCCYMSVECPFGSDMDVKAVPSCDFKKHFCRYFLTAQEFPFVFVELLMPSGFFFLSFLFFFSFPFQTLFFLPFCIRLTGLYQGSGVKTEGIEYMDRQEGDDFSILRILQDVFNPVLAIGCRFFPVTLLVKDSA